MLFFFVGNIIYEHINQFILITITISYFVKEIIVNSLLDIICKQI